MRVLLEQNTWMRQQGILLVLQMKKNIEILESEQYMCLDCENDGQELAWDTAKNLRPKITPRN